MTEKEKELIFGAIEAQLKRTTKSSFRKYNNVDFENYVFENEQFIPISITKKESKMSQNIILYGPPGTGKTYRLKSKYFEKYTTKETTISSEKNFENVVKDLSWWQVIALALLELGKSKVSGIHENRLVQQK